MAPHFEDQYIQNKQIKESQHEGHIAHGRTLCCQTYKYKDRSTEQYAETGSGHHIIGCRSFKLRINLTHQQYPELIVPVSIPYIEMSPS